MKKIREKKGWMLILVLMITTMLLVPGLAFVFAAPTSNTVVDGDTVQTFPLDLGAQNSTRYVGRIWTDKTVYNDTVTLSGAVNEGRGEKIQLNEEDDFLVAYSVLATSQRIIGTEQVPLDVVFVVDISGSMTTAMTGGTTRIEGAVDAINTAIQELMEVSPNTRIGIVDYSNNSETVVALGNYDQLKLNITTTVSNRTTKYYLHAKNGTKRLTATDGIEITGGTNTQYGIYNGMKMLEGAEDKTIVMDGQSVARVPVMVHLSDGAPTYSGGGNWWEPTSTLQGTGSDIYTVNGLKAMMTGAYMKQRVDAAYGLNEKSQYHASIYNVGVGFSGLSDQHKQIAELTLNPIGQLGNADNTYAVEVQKVWEDYQKGTASLKYKNRNNEREQTYTFTHPAENDIDSLYYADGYFDATSASDLITVFQDIVQNIISIAPTAPTQIQGNDPMHTGYITYTDPLGEYMEVKDIREIIYANTVFRASNKVKLSENSVQYIFAGEVNDHPAYGNVKMSDILITVTTAEDGNQILTIQVPAGAIPLRNNTITLGADGAKSNVSDEVWPMRVFYSVGTRAGVLDAEGNVTEEVSAEYIAKNRNEDGTVNFYSNYYSGTKLDATTGRSDYIGDATSTYVPAATNFFYYITENLPVYLDEACTTLAKGAVDNNTTYYFKFEYFDGLEAKAELVGRRGNEFTEGAILPTGKDGQLEIQKARPRLGFLTDAIREKGEGNNPTETANTYAYPVYQRDTGTFVIYHGNNGVLRADTIGSLTITKEVTAEEGLTAPEHEYTFKVTLKDDEDNELTESFEYAVRDADDKVTTAAIQSGGTIKLKNGATATIFGLPNEAEYTVEEIEIPAGFTNVSGTKQGSIRAGAAAEAAFRNHYSAAAAVLPTGTILNGEKVLRGRDWQDGDSFSFYLVGENEGAPLPKRTTETVTKETAKTFSFGDVTFTKPGSYTYMIREEVPAAGQRMAGLSYSAAAYEIEVVVQDNGQGQLVLVSTTMTQALDDAGNEAGEDAISAVFTNVYEAETAHINIQAEKIYTDYSGNKPLTNNMFSFMIRPVGPLADTAPMPAGTGADRSYVVRNVDKEISFGQMNFTTEMIGKTYSYQISEVIPEGADENHTLKGIAYDAAVYQIDVVVTAETIEGKEHVAATIVYPDGNKQRAAFVNSYTPKPVVLSDDTNTGIKGNKTIMGRDMKPLEVFTFTLSAANEATRAAIAEGSVSFENDGNTGSATVSEGSENVAKEFVFEDVTFTKPGTYQFQMNEADPQAAGLKHDTQTCEVTVVVTDNEGVLEAAVSYNNGTSAADNSLGVFVNTYEPVFDRNTAITLMGTKELTGRPLQSGEFRFVVQDSRGQENVVFNQAPKEEGKADIRLLNGVEYNAAGEYHYTITESTASEKGMNYDGSSYDVTVTVTDDGDGKLTAAVSSIQVTKGDGTTEAAETVTFVNNYIPLANEYVTAPITKILNGGKELEAGMFEFEVTLINGESTGIQLPGRAVNDENGSVQFDNIIFTKAGTYVVCYQEVIPEDAIQQEDGSWMKAGITYDTHELKVTYQVQDNDGQLEAIRGNVEGDSVFTNTYTAGGSLAGTGNLEVTKELVDTNGNPVEWLDNDGFTFVLAAADDVTQAAINEGKVTLPDTTSLMIDKDTTDHSVTFGDITFIDSGNYLFSISESASGIAGITDDGHEAVIRVDVTDRGDGTLDIAALTTVTGALTFTNTYQPAAVTANLTAYKVLNGRDMAADEFTFSVTPENDQNPAPTTMTLKNGAADDGTRTALNFGTITFTKTGIYTYYIQEESSQMLGGVTYDTGIYSITYKVTDDDRDGKLEVTSEMARDGVLTEEMVFTNSYQAASATLNGSENLAGIKMINNFDPDKTYTLTGGEFDFTIAAAAASPNAPLPDQTTVQNDVNGNFAFGDIVYTVPGTYYYLITEETGTIRGMSYADTPYDIEVIVTDNGSGQLQIDVNGNENIEFANIFDPAKVVTSLGGIKNLTGRRLEAGEFTFTLECGNKKTADAIEEGSLALANGKTSLTTTNTPAGTFSFGQEAITIKEEGTYTFQISEEAGTDGHIDYDNTTYTVTATVVWDEEDEALKLVWSDNKEGIIFNNEYTPDATAYTFDLTQKVLLGRELRDGEFEFLLTDGDGNEIETSTNNGDGSVNFNSWYYDEEGTYLYNITETNNGMNGVIYSQESYHIKVVVQDMDGQLTVTNVEITDNTGAEVSAAVFENTYRPAGTAVTLGAGKILNGRDLTEGEFTFILIDKNGTEISRSTNQKDGEIRFDPIKFDQAGNYGYLISEEIGTDTNITYDTTKHRVEIVVTDDGQGHLSADVAFDTGMAPIFTNTYEKEKPIKNIEPIPGKELQEETETEPKEELETEEDRTQTLSEYEKTEEIRTETIKDNSGQGKVVYDRTLPGTTGRQKVGRGAKTGDNSKVGWYFIMMLGGLALIGCMIYQISKRTKER